MKILCPSCHVPVAAEDVALETGLARARALGDHKAAGEIEYLLDELS